MAALAITHTGRRSRMGRLALERAMTEVALSSRRGQRRPQPDRRRIAGEIAGAQAVSPCRPRR
jgi:hypothetical protein